MWQDYVFTAGGFWFLSALVKMLRDKKTAVSVFCSVGTAVFLLAFAVTQWSLGCWMASITETVAGVCWFALACLRPVRAES